MKCMIGGILLIGYNFAFANCIDIEKFGKPLFLTPYIETGRIKQAKEQAYVQHPQIENTESYAGYLTINKSYNSNTFFWYFPSREDPQNDPLLLWMNGGPGSTSLLGLFSGNGPFIITENDTVNMRKYSWQTNHNIIYIDNPVGAGYSFTENNLGYARTQDDVGSDVLAALLQFFKLFPELEKNDFYVTGESYAGKFVSAVSYAIKIYNRNARCKIKLKGLAIGNGLIDPIYQMTDYSDTLFGIGLLNSYERDQMKHMEENISALILQKKYMEATLVFDKLFMCFFSPNYSPSLFKNMTGFDYYYNHLQTQEPIGIRRYTDWVTKFDVRKAIHVGQSDFNPSSQTVKEYLKADFTVSAAHLVADLLEDYKVMIYHGQLDVVITYRGTEKFIANLNWSGAEDYEASKKNIWRVGTDIAGYFKKARNLNLVLVRNGGHFLSLDQPLWAWEMITRFTRNIGF